MSRQMADKNAKAIWKSLRAETETVDDISVRGLQSTQNGQETLMKVATDIGQWWFDLNVWSGLMTNH